MPGVLDAPAVVSVYLPDMQALMEICEVKIAGRCYCGMVDSIVEQDPDAHLRCYGLRWCLKCGEAARFGERCRPCELRTCRAYEAQRRAADPAYKARRNEQCRRWQEKQRREGTANYEKAKASKRLRYRTNPVHHAAHLEYLRRRRAKKWSTTSAALTATSQVSGPIQADHSIQQAGQSVTT